MLAKEETKTTTDDGWEDLSTGYGDEWDFDRNGPLVGNFIGTQEMALPEHSQRDGRTTAKIWQFAVENTGELVFVWDSYSLGQAMTKPGTGDLVRISYEGEKAFTGSDGPRRVKQYKVAMKKN